MRASDKEFIAEAEEILELAGTTLLDIQEALPGEPDPDSVNGLFRAMHTLKGMSGLFGFQGMADISHALENILDLVRLGKAPCTDDLVNFYFRNLDVLRSLVEALKQKKRESIEDVADHLSAIEEFTSALQNPKAEEGVPELAGHEELFSVLSEYEEHRLKSNIKAGKSIYVITVALPIESFDTDLKAMSDKFKESGEVVSTMPTSEGVPDGQIGFNLIVGSVASAATFRAHVEEKGGTVKTIVEAGAGSPPPVIKKPARTQQPARDDVGSPAEPEIEQTLKTTTTTLRVDIEKVDRILSSISELMLVRNALKSVWVRLGDQLGQTLEVGDLHRAYQAMGRRLEDLQGQVLDVRMVPVGQIFSRLSQVIRRYTRRAVKQINLQVFGEETEMDKSIAEEIIDPLMHIVRNAIDHGIESPEERNKQGKPYEGRVQLSAFQRGNNVVFKIEDDGGGIDTERVREKAVEKGIIAADAQLTKQEALELLFNAGFSTASAVSETSGRGVGLDVVREKLTAIGGFVDIETEQGVGTSFIVTLPITLAIVKALTVRVGSDIMCIPLTALSETFMIAENQLTELEGRKVVTFGGQPLTMIRLSDVFQIATDERPERYFTMVVGHGERRMGLMVEECISQDEIVIKPLGSYFSEVPALAGAAELGRDEIALVVDVEGVIDDCLKSSSGRLVRAL